MSKLAASVGLSDRMDAPAHTDLPDLATRSPWMNRLGMALLLAIGVCAVFGRTVVFEFTNWDDLSLITRNPLVNPPTLQAMIRTWTGNDQGLFIPVVYNLWSALNALGRWIGIESSKASFGVPPWPFHLANVLLHLGNAFLVLVILRRFLRFPLAAAGIGAGVFALHPMQAEVVSWATGMKDILSSCFALAAIICQLEASQLWRQGQRPRGHCFYSLALALYFVGSLAKPGIVGAPVIAALLDMSLTSSWRSAIAHAVAPVLVILPSAFLTGLAQSASYLPGIWLIQRPVIALHALGFYVWKVFVPSQLCVDYGYSPLYVLTTPNSRWLMLLPAAFMACLLVARRHRRDLALVGGVFLAGVAPVLGLMPFYFQYYSTVADRYVYLSMLGPAIGIAIVFAGTKRPGLQAGLVLGLVGLACLTYVQAGYWRTSFDIQAHTAAVNPRASAAYNNMASAVISQINMVPELSKTSGPAQPLFAADDPLVPYMRDLIQYQLAVNPHPGPTMQNWIWLEAKCGKYSTAIGLAQTCRRIAAIYGANPNENVADEFGMACLYQFNGDRANAARWLCYGLVRLPGDPQLVRAITKLVQERAQATTQPSTGLGQ